MAGTSEVVAALLGSVKGPAVFGITSVLNAQQSGLIRERERQATAEV